LFLFVLILFRSRYFITFCIINWNIKKVLNKKHCYFFYKFYLLIYKMYCLSSQHDIWRQKVKTASEWGHNNWFVVDNLYNVKEKKPKTQFYFSFSLHSLINIYLLPVTCDGSVVFSGYSGFLHQKNWLPQYNWNIVESGIKHHKQTI
jgi:hypothetical protein